MKRRVAYVTGNRADYGLFAEALKRIREHPALELQVMVTGMHLDPRFDSTIGELEGDEVPITATVPASPPGDTGADQARFVGQATIGIAEALERHAPEIVIVLGDRGEMLAAAVAAVNQNLSLAHVHAGDVSGSVDELFRHAITKLAHLHFTASADATRRVVRMGERPEHVHEVGAPGLDYLAHGDHLPPGAVIEELGLDPSRPLVLFTQHPVAMEMASARSQMRTSLDVLAESGAQVVATYPNADAGGRAMIEELEARREQPWLRIRPSLGRRRYAALMSVAQAMAGNSSSGIIEAPFFGLPVVNIGARQAGRLRAGNVIDVPHERSAIASALGCALRDEAFRERARSSPNPYGDGHAGERIAEVLASLEIGPDLLAKRITY